MATSIGTVEAVGKRQASQSNRPGSVTVSVGRTNRYAGAYGIEKKPTKTNAYFKAIALQDFRYG